MLKIKYIVWIAICLLFPCLLFIFFDSQRAQTPFLILNMWNEKVLPKHFRMSIDPFKPSSSPPSREGLYDLQASGSSQFSINSLQTILRKIPNNHVIVVDLRQESHGFLNGMAISWYISRNWANRGKTLKQIQADEESRIQKIRRWLLTIMFASKKYPLPILVSEVLTEEEATQKMGIGYYRLPLTDHLAPTNQDVDSFISFIKNLPKDAWLHFHCAAGVGRTTTVLAMYDMMRNSQKVSFEDILKRQKYLSHVDFLATPPNDWRTPFVMEKYQFLKNFYNYCKENSNFQIPWSVWLKRQENNLPYLSL